MKNLKNELVYQWRMLKAEVKGGYQEAKRLLNYQDIKEKFLQGLENLKEQDRFEAEQKRFNNKYILQYHDVVLFRDPENYGNEIEAEVLDMGKNTIGVWIKIKVLKTGLRNDHPYAYMQQADIMNNLIKLEKAEA